MEGEGQLTAEEEEAKVIIARIANIYATNAGMLKELQDQAFMKMMNEIPDEILNMQLGSFIDACEDPQSEEAKWGAKKFEFAMS